MSPSYFECFVCLLVFKRALPVQYCTLNTHCCCTLADRTGLVQYGSSTSSAATALLAAVRSQIRRLRLRCILVNRSIMDPTSGKAVIENWDELTHGDWRCRKCSFVNFWKRGACVECWTPRRGLASSRGGHGGGRGGGRAGEILHAAMGSEPMDAVSSLRTLLTAI
jgi:hypothetical protein